MEPQSMEEIKESSPGEARVDFIGPPTRATSIQGHSHSEPFLSPPSFHPVSYLLCLLLVFSLVSPSLHGEILERFSPASPSLHCEILGR